MKSNLIAVTLVTLLSCSVAAFAAAPASSASSGAANQAVPSRNLIQRLMKPMHSTTTGTVTVDGKAIPYKAVAGTLVIHGTGNNETTPEVAMGYFAYFKQGVNDSKRPITFLYNGGPGSSSMWLLMGAYGPERIVTKDHTHTPAAPYKLVNNEYSLLNASDLVFIDMPGTGFGRLLRQGKTHADRVKDQKRLAKKIWGVTGDGEVFSRFIIKFLTKYNRWNSPKYLYGESYGTTRSAVVSNILENQYNIDLNGVILQSSILNFSLSIFGPRGNPGINLPYVLALPTFAATAWYHRELPKYDHDKLNTLLHKVIAFTNTTYRNALYAGATMSSAKRRKVAETLHEFTGLPTRYWLRANLRVNNAQFEHELQIKTSTATGQLDTRFSGPDMDPMTQFMSSDPQSRAISSAYISGFNWYVRNVLKFGKDMYYRPGIPRSVKDFHWNFQNPVQEERPIFKWHTTNVSVNLARAMKHNPNLKIMLNGGFFDLATPFYTSIYEMHHLPIPEKLQKNITYAFYPSGHMIYVHVPSLKKMHANVSKFIEDTDNHSSGEQ